MLTSDGPRQCADLVRTDVCRISITTRYDARANTLQVYRLELVDHQRTKPIINGVDVVDPEQPAFHRVNGDEVARVDDHERDEEGCETGRDVVIVRDRAQKSEECRHSPESDDDDDVEREELAGCSL